MDSITDRPELRRKFIIWLTERYAILEQLAPALESGGIDESVREELTAVCHDLVGTAGSFGFVPISEAARMIDDHLFEGGMDMEFLRIHMGFLREMCRRQIEAEG